MTAARITSGDGDPRHGTANGYGNLKCRCGACRAAWAEKCRVRRERRQAKLKAGLSVVTHGNGATYTNHGCRCRPCTDAHTRDRREWARRA